MQIKTALYNTDHLEYGIVTIPFPIPKDQYDSTIKMLEAFDIGDPRERDCMVREVLGPVPSLKCLEGTQINVDELDYLVKRLDSFSDDEIAQFQAMAFKLGKLNMTGLITQRIAFQGLLRMDEAKGERTISLQRLRNLAASADCCHVVREARSPSQLGRFYAENGFVPEIESLPDSVFELLDFELIGRRAQQGEGGVFTDYGYVVQNSDLNIALGLINKVPQAPKYTVLLELLRGTDNAPDVTPLLLELPLYQRVSMEILKALNSPYQTAYGWRCLDCRVPELAGIIESSSDFAAVETLAAGLSRIDQLDVRLYKAVLSATNCTEISQALELRNQLDQYILDPEIFSPEDQARSELAAMLPEADAQVVASHLNLYA